MNKLITDAHLSENAVSGSRFVPMLFSTPMVQSILNGNKTETRRIIDVDNSLDFMGFIIGDTKRNGQIGFGKDVKIIKTIKPKVNIDDIIWVRETFQVTDFLHPTDENYGYIYKASENGTEWEKNSKNWKWKPSLFMPKLAARIFLKVVSVSVERLQDIDEKSAINEGIENLSADELKYNLFRNYLRFENEVNYQDFTTDNAIWSYQTLWQKINGKDSWDLNPFVWVYKFQRIDEPHGFR